MFLFVLSSIFFIHFALNVHFHFWNVFRVYECGFQGLVSGFVESIRGSARFLPSNEYESPESGDSPTPTVMERRHPRHASAATSSAAVTAPSCKRCLSGDREGVPSPALSSLPEGTVHCGRRRTSVDRVLSQMLLAKLVAAAFVPHLWSICIATRRQQSSALSLAGPITTTSWAG